MQSTLDIEKCYTNDPPSVKNITIGKVIDIYNFDKNKGFNISAICESIIRVTKTENAQQNSCVSKVCRIVKEEKGKRGKYREEYRSKIFSVPTASVTTSSERDSTTESIESKNTSQQEKKQLEERRQKVKELREENKQLRRKLERRDTTIEKIQSEKNLVKKLEKDFKELTKETGSVSAKYEKEKETLSKETLKRKSTETSLREAEKRLRLSDKSEEVNLARMESLTTENKNLCKENDELKKMNEDLTISVDYLESLVEDKAFIKIYDQETNTDCNDFVECVMNLTDLKVATKNVGPVITQVASLLGHRFNRVPTRQTMDNFVDRKVAVAQKQLGQVLSKSKDTTLYTDETRKMGHTYQSYIVSNEHNSYILGLREMVNKSGTTTLETFKEILSDINSYCENTTGEDVANIGHEILVNIKNTMSDRAATEKNFNNLLRKYRSDILPQVIENYDQLSSDQQRLCSQMNNFFCGLHLLIGLADVCESSLRKFETSYLDGKDIGSASHPELKKFHKAESGTLRLLRTCSKAFARGDDEKSGVYLPWRTFLTSKNERNRIQRFRHNRFNMIFMSAQAVYYHRMLIPEFLEQVHGTTNSLLKAVALDSKEDLYLAGVKVLGTISKLITAPLWRLIEEESHILDMNVRFRELVEFLESISTDESEASSFLLEGKNPFQVDTETEDPVMRELLKSNDNVDNIAQPLMMNLSAAMATLLKRMVPEHLPGGQFWAPSQSLREETASAKKHNKMPEYVFGLLDHLVSYRPNASVLANEAYIMYSFNKTSEWLDGLPSEERDRVLEESRKEGREIRKTFKSRLERISETRLDEQRRKKVELERLEKQRIQNAEHLTNEMCFYGLWQSPEQIAEGLGRCNSDAEKVKALQSQLKFRKTVLNQKHPEKKIFNFSVKTDSGRYTRLTVNDLTSNLKELVQSALEAETSETRTSGTPLLVGKNVEHTFTDKIYKGKVISVVPGFNKWYNIIYEGDEAVYAYELLEDYKKGSSKKTRSIPHLQNLFKENKISFVLLDLKTEHLEKILDGKDASGEHNEILYTKTFDIMKAEDRAEVNKFLLWLASVQSNKFRGVL